MMKRFNPANASAPAGSVMDLVSVRMVFNRAHFDHEGSYLRICL